MKLATPLLLFLVVAAPLAANAEVRSLISGNDPYEVQEKAFKQGFQYPVGSMKCGQRCSQWWGRESFDSER